MFTLLTGNATKKRKKQWIESHNTIFVNSISYYMDQTHTFYLILLHTIHLPSFAVHFTTLFVHVQRETIFFIFQMRNMLSHLRTYWKRKKERERDREKEFNHCNIRLYYYIHWRQRKHAVLNVVTLSAMKASRRCGKEEFNENLTFFVERLRNTNVIEEFYELYFHLLLSILYYVTTIIIIENHEMKIDVVIVDLV